MTKPTHNQLGSQYNSTQVQWRIMQDDRCFRSQEVKGSNFLRNVTDSVLLIVLLLKIE